MLKFKNCTFEDSEGKTNYLVKINKQIHTSNSPIAKMQNLKFYKFKSSFEYNDCFEFNTCNTWRLKIYLYRIVLFRLSRLYWAITVLNYKII